MLYLVCAHHGSIIKEEGGREKGSTDAKVEWEKMKK